MLTPFGRLVVTGALARALLAGLLYAFVLTRTGQDLLCGRAGLCLAVMR